MSENKRYYWLKMPEDFFKSLRIKKLRRLAGGDTYTIIYLKLQLLSLNTEGVLQYKGLEKSFEEEIALEIDDDVENVIVTMNYLRTCGLLEIIDEHHQILPWVIENTGSETASTIRSRKCRAVENALQCNTNATLQQHEGNGEIRDESKEIRDENGEETTLTGGKEEAPKQGRRYSLDEAKRVASQSDLPQSVKDALCTWLEYKYLDRRDKYAERGMNQLVSSIKKRVSEYGEDPVSEIILHSVEREWQGIGWENLEKRFKRQKKVYAQDDLFYRTGKTLGNRVSRRLGLPEDTEETRQAYAAEMEACARETGADVGTEIKDAVFFSQSDPFWQSRIVDAKSFRMNFRKILADMRRKDS